MATESNTKIKNLRLQNWCGSCFGIMFLLQFVFQLLLLCGVIPAGSNWYAYVVEFFSVVGFAMLYKLSSSITGEIFSVSLLGVEAFYLISRPFLLALSFDDWEIYSIIIAICVIFSVFALYLWSVLLSNEKFSKADRWWLMLLPLPFVVNIFGYAGFLQYVYDYGALAAVVAHQRWIMRIIRLLLALLMPIGYWKLSHSNAFDGTENSLDDYIDISPANKYLLAYVIILIVFMMPAKWLTFGF